MIYGRPRLGLAVAASLFLVSVLALVTALAFRSAGLQRFEELSVTTCQQVEAVKAQIRAEARRSYRELAESAHLLDIPLTPELREKARESRDTKLRRFARRDC